MFFMLFSLWRQLLIDFSCQLGQRDKFAYGGKSNLNKHKLKQTNQLNAIELLINTAELLRISLGALSKLGEHVFHGPHDCAIRCRRNVSTSCKRTTSFDFG